MAVARTPDRETLKVFADLLTEVRDELRRGAAVNADTI